MLMTKERAYEILDIPEGSSKEKIKQVYTKAALTNHPDQKTSSLETTQIFKEVSLAYKRLQQPPDADWVEMSNLMEQFSSIFRFRMKTDSGYVYFMYNPYTGLADSDDEDDDVDSLYKYASFPLSVGDSWNDDKKIVELEPGKYEEMQARANKCAEELINEEDKAKRKAQKRREKKLRQREKKKLLKESLFENNYNENKTNDENTLKVLQDHQKLLKDSLKNDAGTSRDSKRPKIPVQVTTTLTTTKNGKRTVLYDEEALRAILALQQGIDDIANHAKKSSSLPKTTAKKKKKSNAVEKKEARNDGSDTKDSDAEEPDWDHESAFVSKAAKQIKGKQKPVNKANNQHTEAISKTENLSNGSNAKSQDGSTAKAQDMITLSRQLAMQGNQLAGNGGYNEAVELFTKAISLYGTDCRYYGNRSYCYDRMEQYDLALEDANTAINLSAVWAKGYFRKGRALAGLKRYVDAEHAFEEVLKLDKNCIDAEQELHAVRIKHLMDMGFSKKLCEVALRKKGTIQLALDELLSGVLAGAELKDVYVSDDEEDVFEKELNQEISSSQNEDVFSEVDYNSLWVGNITSQVTERALHEYFSQFGMISSVSAMYARRCAFVNFSTTEAARLALAARDTVEIAGALLVIRYPDRAYNQASSRFAYKSKRECFYWRNRGCHFGSACRYLHVAANKGIDLQTVERTPYQSIVQLEN